MPNPKRKFYASAPEMLIDTEKSYSTVFKLAKGGEFTIQLHADKSPVTVNSFVFLARDGFFDGVTFHRVLDGFMAQGGDPTGTGSGGPGYKFRNEDSDLKFDREGVVANGSQFFITYAPQPHLDDQHTIFGRVIEGMEVVESLTPRDPAEDPDAPPGDRILSIEIIEVG